MNINPFDPLPVAVIGGGPVGLAAAAHLLARGVKVKLYEAGERIAENIRDWRHVRLFSPWRYCTDEAATQLLASHGWRAPAPDLLPTGGDLVDQYLEPLSALPQMASIIETGARVTAIGRQGIDKVVSKGRDGRPFALTVKTAQGSRRDLARAVIDASGTWSTQNPMGAAGLAADGEVRFRDRIAYGIPDVLKHDRAVYAGRRVLVIGAGHSAANALLDLAGLANAEKSTTVTWATRGTDLARIYGGGLADQLPARGELGADVKALVDKGRVTLITGFSAGAVRDGEAGLLVDGEGTGGRSTIGPVDRIIVATGQRPDLELTREVRLELDPWLESTRALGPLIDPNVHSCGSVPPHGHRELAHPEPGFYTVGIKSYGRAPTFLLLTGYEQVRSVAAALAGDLAAADDVRLVLPETGVCSAISLTADAAAGCCGGPAPVEADAGCVADAKAKAENQAGCGCRAAA
jgi:thioredoxin reductase